MNVGGVGAMGIAGAGLACGAPPTGCMGGLNGPLGDFQAAGLNGTRMGQLTELLGDFTSAEILMALMLAAGSKRDRDHGDDLGLGLLLGLSLAAQIGQGMPQFNSPSPSGISAAPTGQMINLTA